MLQMADTLSAAERERIPAVVVYVSERDGSRDVRVLDLRGSDRALVRSRYDEYPAAVSRDGRQVVVVTAHDSGGRHLERLSVVTLDGGGSLRIPLGIARARNPSWSADARSLVVESDERGFADIFRVDVVDAARKHPPTIRRLTSASAGSFEPSVSPDGRLVAFVTSRDGNAEVYVMRSDGSGSKRLTAFHRDDWAPRWSPDGAWIAFLSNRTGRDRVYLVRPDGRDLRALTRSSPEQTAGEASSHAWSPDGRQIAYVIPSAFPHRRQHIWIADVATGRSRPIAEGSDPAWSPNGRYIAFTSNRSGDGELFLMRADGSGQTRLTKGRGVDWLPRWAKR
jgi:TolB protein